MRSLVWVKLSPIIWLPCLISAEAISCTSAKPPEARWQVTTEDLAATAREIRPMIEKATGKAFRVFPQVLPSSCTAIQEAWLAETLLLMRLQMPFQTEEEHRKAALTQVADFGRFTLAKYEAKGNRIHINTECSGQLLTSAHLSDRAKAEFVRALLIHEAVHSLDEQEYRLSSKIVDLKTKIAWNVWTALVEGHAQQITHTILAKEHKEAIFSALEYLMKPNPLPRDAQVQWFLSRRDPLNAEFSYIDGRRFFEELIAKGWENVADDVFARPPTSTDTILHPEQYYHPKVALPARDITLLLDELTAQRAEWCSDRTELGECEIRYALGEWGRTPSANQVLTKLKGGQLLTLWTQDSTKTVGYLLVQMDGEESAAKLCDLLTLSSRAKAEILNRHGKRIKELKRGPLKTKCTDVGLARSMIQEGSQALPLSFTVALLNEWAIEIFEWNEESTDDQISEILNRIAVVLIAAK